MKRMQKLEYPWIFKDSFYVYAYTIKHNNGKKYIVYAHNVIDMRNYIAKLDIFEGGLAINYPSYSNHFATGYIISYIPDKQGEPKKKPFWYRGRVYEMGGVNND